MASTHEWSDKKDAEMTYNFQAKEVQRGNGIEDRSSSVLEQDEREIHRMGKVSLYKVSTAGRMDDNIN